MEIVVGGLTPKVLLAITDGQLPHADKKLSNGQLQIEKQIDFWDFEFLSISQTETVGFLSQS